MFEALGQIAGLGQNVLLTIFLVFVRVSAAVAFLPGFGERSVPMRIRLGLSLAFTALVWPMIDASTLVQPQTQFAAIQLIFGEAMIGLAFGLSIRLLVMALQLTGSIAAQSTSLAQIMGAVATPDPMPAIGNILVLGGMAYALAADLHIKATIALANTYKLFPMGALPDAADLAAWGVSHASAAFALAFTLAAPFVIASFAYNLTLGVINRAMPQLMVAFIGAPAITGGGIAILLLATPVILGVWLAQLDHVMDNPFGDPR